MVVNIFHLLNARDVRLVNSEQSLSVALPKINCVEKRKSSQSFVTVLVKSRSFQDFRQTSPRTQMIMDTKLTKWPGKFSKFTRFHGIWNSPGAVTEIIHQAEFHQLCYWVMTLRNHQQTTIKRLPKSNIREKWTISRAKPSFQGWFIVTNQMLVRTTVIIILRLKHTLNSSSRRVVSPPSISDNFLIWCSRFLAWTSVIPHDTASTSASWMKMYCSCVCTI